MWLTPRQLQSLRPLPPLGGSLAYPRERLVIRMRNLAGPYGRMVYVNIVSRCVSGRLRLVVRRAASAELTRGSLKIRRRV